MLKLPSNNTSYWRRNESKPVYPQLEKDLEIDVAIVGAGIAGLSCAYLLKQSNLSVAVLEKDTVGHGTTGHTTGKVTSQHSLIYDDLKKHSGEKAARLYGEANQAGLEQIGKIIQEANIDCGWQREDNYVFTDDATQVKQFRREVETAAKLGLPATFTTDLPLPFTVKAAIKFSDQAKIDAQQYLLGLAAAVNGHGSHVYEQSRVIGIRDGEPGRVKTKAAKVTAKNIIVATNVPSLPLVARGAYCALEYPQTSYIVAGRPKNKISGMYISPDKHHYSILPVSDDQGPMLLIGGENHITAAKYNSKTRYQRLAAYAQEHFGVSKTDYAWKARDYMAYDDLPLVGKVYPWSKHLYTATAFHKWGLTNGTAAAMILTDLINGQATPWAATFNPQRTSPIKAIPRVIARYIG